MTNFADKKQFLANQLNKRNIVGMKPKTFELVETNPEILGGKPVIKGTRISVELILDKLAEGESIEEVLEAHPRLTVESIRAAIAFAAENLKSDFIYPLKKAISKSSL